RGKHRQAEVSIPGLSVRIRSSRFGAASRGKHRRVTVWIPGLSVRMRSPRSRYRCPGKHRKDAVWILWLAVRVRVEPESIRDGGGRLAATKKGACRSTPPKPKPSVRQLAGGGGVGCRRGCLRGRLDRADPAAERLKSELGELFRPDAIVLLDHSPYGVGQSLALGEQRLLLLRRLLLAGCQGTLLLVEVHQPVNHCSELGH